ncbi:LOW QUALITY PROTEIN: hypothetical protein CVT26_005257, partial [Gymnopilus dilepis]
YQKLRGCYRSHSLSRVLTSLPQDCRSRTSLHPESSSLTVHSERSLQFLRPSIPLSSASDGPPDVSFPPPFHHRHYHHLFFHIPHHARPMQALLVLVLVVPPALVPPSPPPPPSSIINPLAFKAASIEHPPPQPSPSLNNLTFSQHLSQDCPFNSYLPSLDHGAQVIFGGHSYTLPQGRFSVSMSTLGVERACSLLGIGEVVLSFGVDEEDLEEDVLQYRLSEGLGVLQLNTLPPGRRHQCPSLNNLTLSLSTSLKTAPSIPIFCFWTAYFFFGGQSYSLPRVVPSANVSIPAVERACPLLVGGGHFVWGWSNRIWRRVSFNRVGVGSLWNAEDILPSTVVGAVQCMGTTSGILSTISSTSSSPAFRFANAPPPPAGAGAVGAAAPFDSTTTIDHRCSAPTWALIFGLQRWWQVLSLRSEGSLPLRSRCVHPGCWAFVPAALGGGGKGHVVHWIERLSRCSVLRTAATSFLAPDFFVSPSSSRLRRRCRHHQDHHPPLSMSMSPATSWPSSETRLCKGSESRSMFFSSTPFKLKLKLRVDPQSRFHQVSSIHCPLVILSWTVEPT